MEDSTPNLRHQYFLDRYAQFSARVLIGGFAVTGATIVTVDITNATSVIEATIATDVTGGSIVTDVIGD